MNNNYEAQHHFTSQKLAARRQQAETERLLKMNRPARDNLLKRLLARFLRPSKQQHAQTTAEQDKRGAQTAAGAVKG